MADLRLTSIVDPGAILVPLVAGERDAAITEMIDALVKCGAAPQGIRDELVARVLDRERRGSTGFGKGIAVPHVKHRAVTKMSAAIGLSPRGIDFNSLDRQPVYSVVLLLSPEDRPEEHLQAMEVVFKNLGRDTFRRYLRQSAGVSEVVQLLADADGSQLPG
ncbi:MAG: PTS sugar transporter subunit IIA [Phycisphaerales bacterium]